MKTLVCLPTFNEIRSIDIMIDKIKKLGFNLILCDQDSRDGTIENAKMKNIPVYQRDGYGKGWGVRKALEVAKDKGYDFLVMIDCDCTYLPENIPPMLTFFENYDMVVGRRNFKDIQFSHRLVNVIHTQLVNLLFGSCLHDINSGIRALRVDKFAGRLKAKGFDIEAEISSKAVKNKLRIKEIPVGYRTRVGKSKIKAFDTFVIIARILKERFKSDKK